MIYRTKDGDVLDAICDRHYVDVRYNIDEVLAANPGLAAHGPVLPSGVLVVLPVVETAAPSRPTIRLWD